MEKLINWWFRINLLWRKRRMLFEVQRDIEFILAERKKFLEFDDAAARQELATFKQKEAPTEADFKRIEELEVALAEAKATRIELFRLRRVDQELPAYIARLK